MDIGGSSEIFTSQKRGNFFKRFSTKNKVLIIIIILLLLGVGGYVFFKSKFGIEPEVIPQSQSQVTAPVDQVENVIEESLLAESNANYQSENFRVGEVAIGGEAEFFLTENGREALEISSVRGESFTEKNKKEVKLVISWKTNTLAKSEVSYSKGVGQTQKVVSEDDYSLSHSVIIPGLDQASTYVYVIKSSDRFGNEIASDPYAIYTGSRTVSLFDLIAGAIGDVFGWAVRKN